jgi:uncharacterized protein YacL
MHDESEHRELEVIEGFKETADERPTEFAKLPIPWWRIIAALAIGSVFAAAFFQFAYDPLEKITHTWSDDVKFASIRFSQACLSVLGFIVGLGVLHYGVRAFEKMGGGWTQLSSGSKVTAFLGVFIGLVASVPFMFLMYTLVNGNVLALMVSMIVLIVGFSTGSVYVLRSMDDILPWNRNQSRRRTGIKILDTNVIIDGRIYDVARAGFLEGQLYVPGFVLAELQFIADSHDPLRRQRGRRGLDVLRHLQGDFNLEVKTYDRYAGASHEEVDARLVRLARAIGADIVTNDFNLNRVATLQDVRVLNLNDLSLALRPNVLPQETLSLPVSREGNQPFQGVGYLDDGTMVVVENGKQFIGETIDVVVTQVIQTERGKMIFAQPPGDEPMDFDPTKRRTTGPRGRH